MNSEEIRHNLDHIPARQEVFVRQGDDMYPATIRFFKSNGKVTPVVEIDMKKLDHHRNYPEGYRGVEEVKF